MKKKFNVTGACKPDIHYMVSLDCRLREIKTLVDAGEYFSINRARQYGKTTTLRALRQYLQVDYNVVSMDFQLFSHASFADEASFVQTFAGEILEVSGKLELPEEIKNRLYGLSCENDGDGNFRTLFICLRSWCGMVKKPVVLMIDEIDSATNNQVFQDFLAQLRGYYIHRDDRPTFQSVILAGVCDVKNLRQKIRQDEDHRMNSPWNIAADFDLDMSFHTENIMDMLKEYEADHETGMDIQAMAQWLYDYTSGYPFLVSRLCKLLDEQIAGSAGYPDEKSVWTYDGFQQAVKILLAEKNTLFESMVNKLYDYPELKTMIYQILFQGGEVLYNSLDRVMEIATMYGFVKNDHGKVAVANRIFETVFYKLFLTWADMQETIA